MLINQITTLLLSGDTSLVELGKTLLQTNSNEDELIEHLIQFQTHNTTVEEVPPLYSIHKIENNWLYSTDVLNLCYNMGLHLHGFKYNYPIKITVIKDVIKYADVLYAQGGILKTEEWSYNHCIKLYVCYSANGSTLISDSVSVPIKSVFTNGPQLDNELELAKTKIKQMIKQEVLPKLYNGELMSY